jgi:hypothetical protein
MNNIQQTIKRILREEYTDIGERTKMERYISKQVETDLPETIKNDNYYGVVVDIYDTDYGKVCRISVLFKRPFTENEADEVHNKRREIQKTIRDLVQDFFKGGISMGVSTLDSYNDTSWYYESKKTKK